jgi:DNA-repair protein complementing XP-A cells
LNLEYCEFDLSKIQDTKGGFFIPKPIDELLESPANPLESPANPLESPANQSLKPQLESTRALDEDLCCSHCPSIDLDWKIYDFYRVLVCKKCKKDRPDEYSLLTKTECKQDYLLTDEELNDTEKMPHQIRKNPHKSTYSNMLLYLRKQVEEFAWMKWG